MTINYLRDIAPDMMKELVRRYLEFVCEALNEKSGKFYARSNVRLLS